MAVSRQLCEAVEGGFGNPDLGTRPWIWEPALDLGTHISELGQGWIREPSWIQELAGTWIRELRIEACIWELRKIREPSWIWELARILDLRALNRGLDLGTLLGPWIWKL